VATTRLWRHGGRRLLGLAFSLDSRLYPAQISSALIEAFAAWPYRLVLMRADADRTPRLIEAFSQAY